MWHVKIVDGVLQQESTDSPQKCIKVCILIIYLFILIFTGEIVTSSRGNTFIWIFQINRPIGSVRGTGVFIKSMSDSPKNTISGESLNMRNNSTFAGYTLVKKHLYCLGTKFRLELKPS